MWTFFDSAVENELIAKNPITKSVKSVGGREIKEKRSLTVEEQKLFLETIKDPNYYNPCALILQTGLRVGELIGLHWPDIDFENGVLHVCRTMEIRSGVVNGVIDVGGGAKLLFMRFSQL